MSEHLNGQLYLLQYILDFSETIEKTSKTIRDGGAEGFRPMADETNRCIAL